MDIVVAITGASGGVYARRVIQGLVAAGVHTHLVVSPAGWRLLGDELGVKEADVAALAGVAGANVTLYDYNDIGARPASGSFRHDGMVIVPCSSNTLGELACGLGGNLIARAAACTMKERRRLVLCHREMPLSPVDVRNYGILTEAGAIIAPANPGWYLHPTGLDDLVNFVAGRLLDLLGVDHAWKTRWEPPAGPRRASTIV